eukprot:gnl/TRDRNA2_/TRDRNA2_183196_c0_seq1.p1 gnl/TRDRNA2_/TRDRNA2_183196_c0~~gnl/TRDRNA2_/TRDRNA2_183196_c0_seq1.p1  ORF type:complete len:310 (-),score=40.97 gnl/TRDRNA2_/TRDRNA2_183196_c0_seq1:154-1083(-)
MSGSGKWRMSLRIAVCFCLWVVGAAHADAARRASGKPSRQHVLQGEATEASISLHSGGLRATLHEWLHTLSLAAVVTTVALQMSPLPSSLEIKRERDVKRYDGYPYFAVLAGATQWCIYGAYGAWATHDINLLTMVAANGPGVMLGIFYVSNFFAFVPADDARDLALKRYLRFFCGLLLAEFTSCLVIGHAAVFWLGLLGAVGSAQIALSPFKTLPEVIKTRSTRSWPLDLCLWNMIQSVATGGFGFANNDPWVWVPNLIGVIAAAIQLTLVAMFWVEAGSPQVLKAKMQEKSYGAAKMQEMSYGAATP